MHICGQCNQQFNTEEDYLGHKCPSTGFTPTQPEHLGPEFKAISEAALARGATRVGEEVHPSEAPEIKADPTQEIKETQPIQPIPETPEDQTPLVKPLTENSLISAVRAAKAGSARFDARRADRAKKRPKEYGDELVEE